MSAGLRHAGPADGPVAGAEAPPRPTWVSESVLLEQAYGIAAEAHRGQRRATDGRPFLEHVTEVAALLHEAGFDEQLVAVGLLHDSVERGTLTEDELRAEMGEGICTLVMTLSEDPTIEPFDARKAALREQVSNAGGRAVTVFAADKLSDILGLRRGIQAYGDRIEERMGTSVSSMAGHYRESVEVIESADEPSTFLPPLHAQLDRLDQAAVAAEDGSGRA